MTRLKRYLFPIALLAAPLAALADDWNRPAPREVFADGNCRVERFVNRDGGVMERRLCRGDRKAYARDDDDDHDEDEDEDDQSKAGRHGKAPRGILVARPGSYAAARHPQHDTQAPAPRYRTVEPRLVAQRAPAPVAVKTRVLTTAVPMVTALAPRVLAKAPLHVTTRIVAQAAAAPRIAYKASAAPKAPRVLARAAPARAARVLAKAPAVAPQMMARTAPAVIAPRVVAKVAPAPKPVRLAVRAAPVARAPRAIAAVQPVAKPARVIARVEPATAAPRLPPVAAPAAKAPRLIARAEPVAVEPRALGKAEPVAEPRVGATVAAVGKSPGNYPKSDWLVTLPAAEQEPTEAVVKAPPVAAKVTTGPKPLIAKVEPDWQRHEYREYVVEKSKDRYSNLK